MRSPVDELVRGTGPELCSPVEALIAALSSVAQLHRHLCCFCSKTAALGICVWLQDGCSCTFLRLGVLFSSFPSAARGYLLSPLSFSRLHTLCVVTRTLSSELLSTCCLWMRRCCFGVRVPALPCEALVPQPCGHHSRGEALFRRASGQHSARCHWLCSVAPPCRWRTLAGQANLLSAVSRHDVL